MEIQLMEGFDQVPGATDVRDTLVDLGYTIKGAGTSAWGEGRNAESQALALTQAASTVALERSFAFDDTLVTGFAVNTTERAQILSINGDALVLGWDDEGVHLRDQVSKAKPIRNRWYYIELAMDKSALECRVYINGALDMTTPLPDALATADRVRITLGGVNPTNVAGQEPPNSGDVTAVMRFDDWIVADERMGTLEIRTRFPTSDVTSEWNTPTGEGPHWPEVTQQPPSADRYITSYETGAIDTYSSDTALPEGANVLAVSVTARARKGDIDNRALGLIFGGQEQLQKKLTLEDAWYVKYFSAPDGAPWSAADVNADPFGVAVR